MLIGGTGANGLGAALLYSGTRGGDWREHSATKIDDVMLKSRYAPNEVHTFNSLLTQYYDGEADMPGGLGRADYHDDPYQSTRPYDKFWGRRTSWRAPATNISPNASQKLNVTGFYTKTLRSGYLDQGKNLTLSPREYWVRGLEPRFSQGFELGESRPTKWASATATSTKPPTSCATGPARPAAASCPPPPAPTTATPSPAPRPTPSTSTIASTSATGPSPRASATRRSSRNRRTYIKNNRLDVSYNAPLPALNVMYHLKPNTGTSTPTPKAPSAPCSTARWARRCDSGKIEPEKARTWELGTRYDDGMR